MRPFNVLAIEQRSDAWIASRLGRLTSSCADAMLSEGRGSKESAGRRNLRIRLALERVTGRSQERTFQSAAMQYGAEMEAEAYGAYEALTGELLQRTGFLSHRTLMVGASLDGHIGEFDGCIEIKCPLSATHWEYLRTGRVPTDYFRQITHLLWVSGAEFCDWMSYDQSFPEPLRAKLVRVHRRDVDLSDYEKKALAFLAEVEVECQAIQTMANLGSVLAASA